MMKKNSNLLTRGKKVALMVFLTTSLTACAQKDNNDIDTRIPWVIGLAVVGVGMYGIGYAKGRSRGDK